MLLSVDLYVDVTDVSLVDSWRKVRGPHTSVDKSKTNRFKLHEIPKNHLKMSAAFKLAKQKSSQKDLRRLMQDTKQQRSSQSTEDKIDSPFAKFDNGQLNCVLCKSTVKSAAVWKVHVNGKQHKENLAIAKQLKEKLEKQPKPLTPEERVAQLKRSAEVLRSEGEAPEKRIKGILKNSSSTTSTYQPTKTVTVDSANTKSDENGSSTAGELPADFFDTTQSSTAQSKPQTPHKSSTHDDGAVGEDEKTDDPLPEGFFDDPVKDAKIRNQEYHDPVEMEWDKFQKEIKEAEVESANIINEDYEGEIVERQIEEIDVQMRNWSKWVQVDWTFIEIHF